VLEKYAAERVSEPRAKMSAMSVNTNITVHVLRPFISNTNEPMSSGSLRYHDPPSQTDARVYTLQDEVYTTTTPYNFQINGESLILLTKNKPTGLIGVRQTIAAIAASGALKMEDQKMQDLKLKDILRLRRAFVVSCEQTCSDVKDDNILLGVSSK